MEKNQFRPKLCSRPHGGAYSTPRPLAGFKGYTSKGGDRKGKKGRGDDPKSWFIFMFKIL